MKNKAVYILALALLCGTLAGCGANDEGRRSEEPIEPIMTPMPDVGDGIVNDEDGVITEGDNGLPMVTERPDLNDNGSAKGQH